MERRRSRRRRWPRRQRSPESPRLTALLRARPGRVGLEVDGRPWRTVPDDVVMRAALFAGMILDRPALRRLRRELRRAEALTAAGRALARRDLSRSSLEERLRRAGVAPAEERNAIATLEGLGFVDDARVARARGEALAARGWGDAAIAVRLESEGFDGECVAAAIAELPPELERVRAIARREPDPRRLAVLLRRRGFGEDAIEAAMLDVEP